MIKLLQQHYGKDLRFVFRNSPLTQLHPEAEPAAEISNLPKIKADFDSGVQSGVAGTPTFFINGDFHQGSADLESMAAAIEAYRQSAGFLRRSARRSIL